MTTIATELASQNQRVCYILCIEGVGWVADESSAYGGSEDGFYGNLLVTHKYSEDSVLEGAISGITIQHTGLKLPDSIKESLDPITLEYKVSGLNFSFIDDENRYLLANYSPHRTGTESALSTALAWSATTVVLTTSTFATNAVVWVGGRECIRLGTRSGAGPYTYTDCIRGYLGTPRGRYGPYATTDGTTTWAAGTVALSVNKFIHDRRVRLYQHVPGYATDTGSCRLLYSGRVRDLTSDHAALEWSFSTTGEQVSSHGRIRKAFPGWETIGATLLDPAGAPPVGVPDGIFGLVQSLQSGDYTTWPFAYDLAPIAGMQDAANNFSYLQLAFFYTYRTTVGGAAGAYATLFDTYPHATPQSETINDDAYIIDQYMTVGGVLVRAIKKRIGSAYGSAQIMCDRTDYTGASLGAPPMGAVRFCLDNVSDEYATSRFAVNRSVKRNPVDVLLIFLTSSSGEKALFDADVTSTTTEIKTPTQYVDDVFAGYALHNVEGTNKGQARLILSNVWNGSFTVFTVANAYAGGVATGDQYQVRNTIYDVLPVSWGLGVDAKLIDIASFENVRDKYLANASLGRFVLGDQDELDILSLLQQNVCAAYGLVMYTDRQTGKLSLRYIGDAYTNGLIDTYTAITKTEITAVGDISHGASMPIGRIILKTRGTGSLVTRHRSTEYIPNGPSYQVEWTTEQAYNSPSLEGAAQVIELVSPELLEIYAGSAVSELKVSAMLNSEDDVDSVLSQLYGRLRRQNTPDPTLPIRCDIATLAQSDMQAGAFLIVTHDAVVNPFEGTMGITAQAARILESSIELKEINPGVQLTVELLNVVAGAKIAPALTVLSKGSDGSGQYLVCSKDVHVLDPDDDRDHDNFVLGDAVTLRSKTGLVKEDVGTITGFGTNFATTPAAATEGATDIRIYVSDAAIASTIATGDYLTFSSAITSARFATYSKYATTAETLGDGSTAREYGA